MKKATAFFCCGNTSICLSLVRVVSQRGGAFLPLNDSYVMEETIALRYDFFPGYNFDLLIFTNIPFYFQVIRGLPGTGPLPSITIFGSLRWFIIQEILRVLYPGGLVPEISIIFQLCPCNIMNNWVHKNHIRMIETTQSLVLWRCNRQR